MADEEKKEEQTQENPQTEAEAPQGEQETPTEKVGTVEQPPQSKQSLMFVVVIIFLILIGAVLFYLYQMSYKSTKYTTPPTPTQKEVMKKTTDELSVPAVSESTDLQTIEKEIQETSISSAEADLQGLDKEAEGL